MKLPKYLPTCIMALLASLSLHAQEITFADTAELFMPNLVSTKNADVKITFSPDGDKMLWGGIGWIEGKTDQDIWQSDRVNGQWSKPGRVSFDTDSNDFDPYFSPDGKGVYFFSNRPGGFGGDDIYFVRYNSKTNTYSAAINLGSAINTKQNEWAPITDAKAGYLIFSSGGHNSVGGQDMFKAKILTSGYGKPQNIGAMVNSADDDFDAALLPGNILIYTSAKGPDKKADLYAAFLNKKDGRPIKLPPQINAADFWAFGPSINLREPGYLYFSSHHKNGLGRTDIYRIKYYLNRD